MLINYIPKNLNKNELASIKHFFEEMLKKLDSKAPIKSGWQDKDQEHLEHLFQLKKADTVFFGPDFNDYIDQANFLLMLSDPIRKLNTKENK